MMDFNRIGRAAILFASLAADAGAGPFDGDYYPRAFAADNETVAYMCSDAGQGPRVNSIIDNVIWLQFEEGGACELTNPVTVRDMDAILYDANCEFEGFPSTQRLFFRRRSADAIDIIGWDYVILEFNRCP